MNKQYVYASSHWCTYKMHYVSLHYEALCYGCRAPYRKAFGGIAKYACTAYIQIHKCYNKQLCHGSFTNNCQQSQEHFYLEEYLPSTDGSFFTSDTWLTSFSCWFINTFVYYKIIQLFIILNKFVSLNSICFLFSCTLLSYIYFFLST